MKFVSEAGWPRPSSARLLPGNGAYMYIYSVLPLQGRMSAPIRRGGGAGKQANCLVRFTCGTHWITYMCVRLMNSVSTYAALNDWGTCAHVNV